MVSEGVVAAGNIAVGGAVKLAALKAMTPVCSPIFANERPVVLYNPHFSSALGHDPRPRPQIGEHTSELQSPMRTSYAVFCLTTKKKQSCEAHIQYQSPYTTNTNMASQNRSSA